MAVGAESEAGVVPGVATDQLDKSLPGVGAVMADLIATGETDIPISEFRIDRFNQPKPQNSATLPQ